MVFWKHLQISLVCGDMAFDAQMLSLQRAMVYAKAVYDLDLKQYYTNATIKLANCFVQQVNMLAKQRCRIHGGARGSGD